MESGSIRLTDSVHGVILPRRGGLSKHAPASLAALEGVTYEMKHLRSMTKRPVSAQMDFPLSVIILFVQDILEAVLNLAVAKEETDTTP